MNYKVIILVSLSLSLLPLSYLDAANSKTLNVIESLVEKSDIIVQARLLSQKGEWQDNAIVTRAKMMVREDLTEQNMSEIEIIVPGGVAIHPILKGKVRTSYSHGINLKSGEEY